MNTQAASQLAGPSAHVTLADGTAGSDADASSVASRLSMRGGPEATEGYPTATAPARRVKG